MDLQLIQKVGKSHRLSRDGIHSNLQEASEIRSLGCSTCARQERNMLGALSATIQAQTFNDFVDVGLRI